MTLGRRCWPSVRLRARLLFTHTDHLKRLIAHYTTSTRLPSPFLHTELLFPCHGNLFLLSASQEHPFSPPFLVAPPRSARPPTPSCIYTYTFFGDIYSYTYIYFCISVDLHPLGLQTSTSSSITVPADISSSTSTSASTFSSVHIFICMQTSTPTSSICNVHIWDIYSTTPRNGNRHF